MLRVKEPPDRALCSLARAAREICREAGVIFIVNDRADVAALVGADGVHVGDSDLPPEAARAIVGPDRWVGVSTHDPEGLAAAVAAGADYVGYGPVWESPTKVGVRPSRGVTALARAVELAGDVPVVAIGGITEPDRVTAALRAGACAAAVLSAVSHAPDMRSAARRLARAAEAP